MDNRRKAYEEKIEAQLKEWNAQIDLFKAKADRAKAEAKIDFYKTIDILQGKEEEARAKLKELKTAGDAAWEDVKKGVDKAWAEIKSAYKDAASRFK
jgi:hypothetical protein